MAGFQARAGAVGGVVHDIRLAAWALLALTRAAGRNRVGPVDAAVVGVSVITGVPAAVTCRESLIRAQYLAMLARVWSAVLVQI
ncbi:hypothetical protein WEH80_13690 [Actinomycetes bacterium KLBMP 9759]